MSRRRLLALSVQLLGASAAGSLLAACGQQAPAAPTAAPVAKTESTAAKPAAPAATAAKPAATTAPVATAAKPAAKAEATTAPAAATTAPAAKTTGAAGGTLRVGHIANPSQLDPHRSPAGFDRHIQFAIFDTLVGFDRSLKPQPGLALSWDSPDLKTWTFKLRQGVKFHDGTDFNAQAVKANIDRIKDPATKSALGGAFNGVQSVEVVDPYTIRFNLTAPNVGLPMLLSDKGGMISSPAAMQKAGADYGTTSAVGTGPFQFVEWKQNDRITLKKAPAYWKSGIPRVDNLEIAIIPDDNVRLANVKTGQLDATYSIAPKDVEALRRDKSLTLVEAPGIAFWQVYINSSRPPFDNVALRQAFAYSVDRDAVLQAAAFGSGQIANSPFTPAFADFYLPDLKVLPRDLGLARQKLQEGGQPNGFEFELLTTNLSVFQATTQIVQAQLAEAGIKANVSTVDDATIAQKGSSCDYQAFISLFTGRTEIDLTLTYMFDPDLGICKNRYNIPEATEQLRKGRQTADMAERKRAYSQLGQIVVDKVMDLPLIYPFTTVVLSPKVKGFEVWGDGMMRWDEVSIQ
ncbi:MAG: hypothetical protein IT305_21950 [Chloroflexi bacterium]|nr:hypothetical protein [Chloroflexota bacterium]